jgi:peptide/nickel transport system permease protein
MIQDPALFPDSATEVTRVDSATSPLRARFPIVFFALRRLIAGMVTLFVASGLIFLSIQALPGNVIQVVLGRGARPERVAQLTSQLHLNDNLLQRYLSFVRDFIKGDFGVSTAALVQGGSVRVQDVVWPAIHNSLVLAGIVLVFFVPLAAVIGLLSGIRAGRTIDHVFSTTTLALGALPEFLIGTVLIYIFFDRLDWLPPISNVPDGMSPLSDISSLVLPVITLLLISLAFGARLLRASIVDVLSREYISVARLNGISEGRIIFRYLLPNALVPSIQILAQQIQYLMGGIVVVESVFNYPGIGATLVRAIAARDVQEIVVIATILSAAYILINIVADLVVLLLDPRVRTSL